jgi:hypothetical protein
VLRSKNFTFRSTKKIGFKSKEAVSEVEKFGFWGDVRFQRRRRLVSATKFRRRKNSVSRAEKLGFRSGKVRFYGRKSSISEVENFGFGDEDV